MGETTCYIRVCYCENSTGHACHCVDKFFHADGDCRSVRVDDGTKNASPEPAANEALVAADALERLALACEPISGTEKMHAAVEVLRQQVQELERLRAKLKAISSECADGHLSAKEAVANIERILGEGGTA